MAVHIFWSYLFVDVIKFDVQGIGIACTITNISIFTVLYIYTNRLDKMKSIPPTTGYPYLEVKGLTAYMKMGMPIVLMICAELTVYELMLIWAGWLGIAEQAATVVL